MVTTSAPYTTQLKDEIEYSESGPRKKILFRDDKNQAVLICIKAGTELPEHESCHDGLMTVLEGRGTFTLPGQQIALEPGVFFSLPAKTPHGLSVAEDLVMLKVVERHECSGHHH